MLASFMVYLLMEAAAVDIFGGLVVTGINSGVIQALTITNFTLSMYRMCLFGVFALVSMSLLSTKKSRTAERLPSMNVLLSICLSIVTTIAITGIISIIYMLPVEGFTVQPGTVLILNALFLACIIKDPAVYMLIEGLVYAGVSTIYNFALRVESD